MIRLSLVLLLALLCGCGGGSTSTPAVSTFAGQWNGTFSNTRDPNPENGTASLTVTEDGEVSGTMTFPNQPGASGVSGTIGQSGQTSFTVTMPTANGVTNVPFTMTGNLTRNGTALGGTLSVQAFGSYQYDQTLTLSKQ